MIIKKKKILDLSNKFWYNYKILNVYTHLILFYISLVMIWYNSTNRSTILIYIKILGIIYEYFRSLLFGLFICSTI